MANRKNRKQQHQDRVFGKLGGLNLVAVSSSDDFIINARGGKIYKDIDKHSYLDIPDSINGKTYEVLSVGTHQQGNTPVITVKLGDLIQVYRLPDDLVDWVNHLSASSVMGIKVLPCKVEFGKRDSGEHYAEIL